MVAANLRMAACAPNFVIHEFFSVDPPYYQEILKERFPALREECLAPPRETGTGHRRAGSLKAPYKYHDLSGLCYVPQVPAGGMLES